MAVACAASTAFAASDYADPKSCSECHAAIAAAYARTGMGRSFSQATRENTVGMKPGASYQHAPSETAFLMLARGGKFYQRRSQTGPTGEEINIDEKQIDYVMGSGNHTRTFLHRTPSGALEQLPLGWYSEGGGKWAMNPGYDTPVQPNSRRKISYECMFCHNAYPQAPPGSLRSEPVFTGLLPEGIDCQRCHGAAARHVELARHGANGPAVRGAIVNPARLSADRAMDVCAQCHLETTNFPLPHSIFRFDKGVFAFRPGERLEDSVLFFDTPPSKDQANRFQIVSAVYRLRMSACFLNSSARLRCTTCHDPHGETAPDYNARCRECHGESLVRINGHRAGSDCVACHMPKRRTDDVVHAVITDHFIQRRRPERDLLAAIPEPHGAELVYHGPVVRYALGPREPRDDDGLYLALAQVRGENNLAEGIELLRAEIARVRPQPPEFSIELADALVKAGRTTEAVSVYQDVLKRKMSADALMGLGEAFEKSGNRQAAADAFRQASILRPANAEALRRLGEAFAKLQRRDEAASALDQSLRADPGAAETYYALATVRSDSARAEAAYREAIRIQPDYAAAHMNLAILLLRTGRMSEARDHFERAIRFHPEYSLGHYNYALMLITQDEAGAARKQLRLALEGTLDPVTRADAEARLRDLER